MKTALSISAVLALSILAGCNETSRVEEPLIKGKTLLTVDFQENQPLQYKFVSSRDIEVILGPAKSTSKAGKGTTSKSTELMELVVAYTPVKIDPYGLTTIKATCKSAKVRRTKSTGGQTGGKDAVESLSGKSFTFTIDPTGKIKDYSQLDELIKEIGKKAFRSTTEKVRTKEPDMIGDFVATQWFLWDAVSSIDKSSQGVAVGQSWNSQLIVTGPMVMRQARDVIYKLEEVRPSPKGQLAVISSSYTLADSVPKSWPVPYSGRFRMSGTFGFFRGYSILELQGQGEELFNIDTGQTQQYNQQYLMKMKASLPLPIGAPPRINIKHKLTMMLLK